MKLSELKTKLCARVLYMPDPEREADGGYCGDFLSFVMQRRCFMGIPSIILRRCRRSIKLHIDAHFLYTHHGFFRFPARTEAHRNVSGSGETTRFW